ncbi:MAG: ATP-binding protein [Desulfatiglandaceae bacterium]
MGKKKTTLSDESKRFDELRRQAERLLQGFRANPEAWSESGTDFKSLLHELEVHQVELEIQNEELRHVQVTLEESRNRYFDLYELAPVGYFTIDGNGLILEVNLRGSDLLKQERRHLKGKLFSRFVLKEDQKIFFSHMSRVLENAAPQICELRLVTAHDAGIYGRMESSPMRNETGDVIHIRSAVMDITQGKRMDTALRDEVEKRRQYEAALKGTAGKILAEVERRRFLSRRLVDTLEKDRRDVAMYLHDEISQKMGTLKMEIELLVTDHTGTGRAVREKLEAVARKVSAIMGQLRGVSGRLRPDVLDTMGLIPAFRSLVESFRDEAGLPVRCYYNEFSQEIDPDKALSLYRITQEALNNVAKHARAKEVFVNLIVKDNLLRLSVEDDGIGFNYGEMAKKTTGEGPLGIMIMRERAAISGGELWVESEIGKGTQVVVEIPID